MRIDEDGAFAGLVGGSPVRRQLTRRQAAPLNGRDARFVTELVSGEHTEVLMCAAAAQSPLCTSIGTFMNHYKPTCAGVTRWRRRLDWLISQLRPTGGKLDPELLQILRLGIFELLELGHPDWTINSHVELAKTMVRPDAGRLVNGMLPCTSRDLHSKGPTVVMGAALQSTKCCHGHE